MSVIIRLQNLPWTANALDIRRFFNGLSIPDGGVHIVGGEKGDAFIAFSTDEDARRAMLMDGGRIGTNALKLYLSSKTEMQNVIAVARGGSSVGNQVPPQQQMGGPPPPPQNQQFQPQAMPNMQNYGPPQQQVYPQSGAMLPPQNLQNLQSPVQMRGGGMPMEQGGMPMPQYGAPQPMEHMQHGDRAPWDNREPDPRDRGDFVRREMVPVGGGFDRPRDVEPRPFNGHGPIDGGRMTDRPMDDFRDQRARHDEFRAPSPRRDRFSPPRDRYMDERRESRKRPFEEDVCVIVRNMPTPLNYRDIRKFFTGLEIPRNGLKLINDRGGNRIGDAFVMFSTPEQVHSALKMDGWMVHGKSVRIEPCTMEAFDRAVDSYVPGATPQNERPMADRPMNDGFVNTRMANKRPRSRSPPKKDNTSLTAVIKNIPFNTTKKDIFRFLTGVKFAKGDLSVQIEYHKDGRPNGVALVELATPRDLDRALRMHRKTELGGRSVEVIHISKNEYKERVERASKNAPADVQASPARSKNEKIEKKVDEKKDEKERKSEGKDTKIKTEKSDSKPKDSSDKKDKDEKKFYCVKLHGVPFDADKSVIEKFFNGLEIAHKGIRLVYLPNGKASHTCFVEFVSAEDCKRALGKDKDYIGSRYINVSPVTRKQMMDDFHTLTGKANSAPPPGSTSVASQVGKPGCVVSIQNLHFNATLEDILHFFKRFGPIANSVKMRYNPEGRPMGDAMLAFHTRADAQRAVSEMDRSRFMGRPLTLAIM